MGKQDKVENSYMENPEHFADFINGCSCQGKQVLKKEHIRVRKQVYTHANRAVKGETWSIVRDVVVEAELEAVIILIGLENQSNVHFAMPLRIMKDDLTNYQEQWKQLTAFHKKEKDLKTSAEYLSGLSKTDKLIPVLTYCIYWGEEEWNGPRTLKDMLNLEGVPAEICELIGDYPINLIEVNKFEHPEYFQTDLRLVFEFLQRRGDFEQMRKYIKEHEEDLRNLPEETFDLMAELSNVKELEELKKTSRNEEECDMCKAFDEMKNIGIREGRSNGFAIAIKVQNMYMKGVAKEKIAETCEIALEEVEKLCETLKDKGKVHEVENGENEGHMCKVFDKMKNIGIREGRKEGMDIIKKVQEMCILGNSKEEIMEICEKFIRNNNVTV